MSETATNICHLDTEGSVHVHFDADVPFDDGCVHIYNCHVDNGISLLADEALRLLTWLQVHEQELRSVANE